MKLMLAAVLMLGSPAAAAPLTVTLEELQLAYDSGSKPTKEQLLGSWTTHPGWIDAARENVDLPEPTCGSAEATAVERDIPLRGRLVLFISQELGTNPVEWTKNGRSARIRDNSECRVARDGFGTLVCREQRHGQWRFKLFQKVRCTRKLTIIAP